MSNYIKYIKPLIVIGLLYIDINSCCKEKKKPNQQQPYSADIKKSIITSPCKINNTKTKTNTKKDNIKGGKVNTEVSPTENNSKVNEKEKVKSKVNPKEAVNPKSNPKEEGKPQINIKIDKSKGITMNKIENISSCEYPPINNHFYNVTTVYETDIKGIQTKEQVENLHITIEYQGYESKPYLLALVYDGKKNYIIFCEDANTKDIYGLFRKTNIESITICNSNNLENACCLFYDCEDLKQLDIINFNTQKLTNISFMFAFCSRLKNINDLKNINFNIVTDAQKMFLKSSIEEIEINLGPKINDLYSMFENCNHLKKIKINNFTYTKQNKNVKEIDIRNIINNSDNIDIIEINTDSEESRNVFLEEIGKKNYKYDEVDKVFKKIKKNKKLKN